MNNEPVDPAINERYPYRYWSIANKKGYGAIYALYGMRQLIDNDLQLEPSFFPSTSHSLLQKHSQVTQTLMPSKVVL